MELDARARAHAHERVAGSALRGFRRLFANACDEVRQKITFSYQLTRLSLRDVRAQACRCASGLRALN